MVVPQSFEGLVSKYALLLGQVGEFLVVTGVLYFLGRLVVKPTVRWLFVRRRLEPTIERAIEKLLGGGVVIGAVITGAWTAGFTAFLGGSALIIAALTLAVGFAAQDVLSNFVAGVFIVQDRNFNIDDWIEWNGSAGFIDDIGFRVTRIRTFDSETITVPNTELATNAVTNRMSNDTLRISYTSGSATATTSMPRRESCWRGPRIKRRSSLIRPLRSGSRDWERRPSSCRPAFGSPTRIARTSP